MEKIFLITRTNLLKDKYFIKFIEEIKDEIIIFSDKNNDIRILSSICPHFGGEIYFDYKNDVLRCKWHGWKFSKHNGVCTSHPIKGELKNYNFDVIPNNLKKFNFDINDDRIYLKLNE